MKHEPDGLSVISWQSRRNRRAKSTFTAWTVLSVLGVVTGFGLTGAQAAGWLHLSGVMAAAPMGLVLLALVGQVVAVTRAMLAWLGG